VPSIIRRGSNGSRTAIRGGMAPVVPVDRSRRRVSAGPLSKAGLRRTWFDRSILAMVAVVFAVPVSLGYLGRHQYRTEHAAGDPTAWTACQAAVRNHLKAPATARFSAPTFSPGTAPEEMQVIGAAVDAQRGDGVWHQTRFVCEANLVGTDWLAYVVFASN
jgi:hypothetical protein